MHNNEYFQSGTPATKLRRSQQRKDLNLSLILIMTVFMFFMFHLPRVLISIYEAFTTQQMVICGQKGLGYYHIWYLYAQATAQLLQVGLGYYHIWYLYLQATSQLLKVGLGYYHIWYLNEQVTAQLLQVGLG